MSFETSVIDSVRDTILCWLATVDSEGRPNISPKEVFTIYENKALIIANIASPSSQKNIQHNPNVCINVIDIFSQKGYKMVGQAVVIDKDHQHYKEYETALRAEFDNGFPYHNIFYIEPTKITSIVSPSYQLSSDTTEEAQIEEAHQRYEEIYKQKTKG